MIDLQQQGAVALDNQWIVWVHVLLVSSSTLHTWHFRPVANIFQDSAGSSLFIAAHQVASPGNHLDAPGPLLLFHKWLQLIERADLVKLAGDKQLGALERSGKAAAGCAIKRQADRDNRAHTWIERRVCQGHIRSEGMAAQANLCGIGSRLSQPAVNRTRHV